MYSIKSAVKSLIGIECLPPEEAHKGEHEAMHSSILRENEEYEN